MGLYCVDLWSPYGVELVYVFGEKSGSSVYVMFLNNVCNFLIVSHEQLVTKVDAG